MSNHTEHKPVVNQYYNWQDLVNIPIRQIKTIKRGHIRKIQRRAISSGFICENRIYEIIRLVDGQYVGHKSFYYRRHDLGGSK